MAEKEKRKHEALNRQEKREQRDFAKKAKQFPYLHREFELLKTGWKSTEPFKNLRLLRNVLALFLAILVGIRYEINLMTLALSLLVVTLAVISFVLIFDKLANTEKNTNRRLKNYFIDKGFISAAIIEFITCFLIIFSYTLALQNLVFPSGIQDSSAPIQANFFLLLCFPMSPLLIIFAMMGFWHIIQFIWLIFEPRRPKIKNED